MREKEVTFTIMELKRFSIINATRMGKMTNKKAALALNLSVRQIIRIIFIPKYTRLFGYKPEDKASLWRKIPDYLNINNILCRRYERKVKNDNTVSVNGQIIQLLPTKTRRHFVRTSVIINHWLDRS